MREHHDIVVIGGGQAGLAMSAVLRAYGCEHVVLERRRVGERWRTERWESLRFQFPSWALELPSYSYSGEDPDGFAHWREVLRVIEQYAASTHAPVHEYTEVTALRADEGGFVLTVPDGTIHARRVVVATGPFQRPRIPQFSEGVASTVLQTDPTRYRCPEDLPDGAVLVVGSGASGCQIGDELLRAGRSVFLSVSRHRRVPRRFRGKDVTWWLDRMGRFDQTIDSFPGRQWPPSVVVTGVNGGYDVNVRQMATDGIWVLGRVLGARDGMIVARSANDVLEEADEAFAGFLAAARELAAASPDCDLAEEETTASGAARHGGGDRVPRPAAREHRGDHLGNRLRLRLRLAASSGAGRPRSTAPAARDHPGARALLPGPALDAHVQVRPVLRRRSRRRVPRRTPGSDDRALTTATPTMG
jgi:putative flavoprotein involved in K+ transport